MTRAAHRFAALDPTRIGPGGLRLRIELALLDTPTERATVASAASVPARQPAPAPARDGRGVARAPAPTPAREQRQPPPASDQPMPGAAVDDPAAADAPATHRTDATPEPAEPRSAPPSPPAAPTLEVVPPADPGAMPHITVGTPGVSTDLERLRQGWVEIVASVRPATKALISECRPLSVDGATITLGFPESKAFLKDVAERKKADLETAVGGYLGRPVAVVCVATNLDLVPPLPGDQEAERILAEARRIFADDLAGVPEVD